MNFIDRRAIVLSVTVVVAVSGLVAGFLAGVPSDVPIVRAACGSGAGVNCGLDTTLTSALDVTHVAPAGEDDPVEPDTGETWQVTAYWKTTDSLLIPAACRCNSASAAVTVDVDWDGSAWSATCTGCNAIAGPVFSVSVCADDNKNCSRGATDHSYGYRLIADVAQINTNYVCPLGGTFLRYLDSVKYQTTSVDDGYELDMESCALDSSVSPTSQSFSATDSGAFECAYNCDASGANVAITYE